MNKYLFILLLIFILPAQAQHSVKPILGVPINGAHPLARGLVGYWLMNEGAGTRVNDLSGNKNTGNLLGDAHFVPGPHGPLVDFDGTGDYINCGDANMMKGLPAMTVIGMAKPQRVAGLYTIASIYDADSVANSVFYIYIQIHSTTSFYAVSARFVNASDSAVSATSSWINDAALEWFHVAGVYDGANVRVYLNGNLLATSAQTGLLNTSTAPFLVGSQYYMGGPYAVFRGQIDHVMPYNRALTAAELRHLYQNPFCIFEQERPELYVTSGEEPTTRPQVIIIMSRLMPLWVILIMIFGLQIAEREHGET